MEEDTGKSLHVGGATGRIHGAEYSLVDYNRAGIPLIEIVTKPLEGAGERAPEVARAYVAALRDLLARARGQRRADGPGLAAVRRERVAPGEGCRGAIVGAVGHADRDQERQLAAQRRAGRPLRDDPPGGPAGGRREGRPGDAALPRGHRDHHLGPGEVGRRGLPVLPRARPRAARARAVLGRAAALHAARAAGRAAQAAAGRLGLHRPRDARRRELRCAGAAAGDRRRRGQPVGRPQVVGRRAGAPSRSRWGRAGRASA